MKKPDFFNRVISEKKDLNLGLVKKVNSFFWKEVKREMSHVEHQSIFLKNFGTLAVSRYNLYKQIKEQIRKARRMLNSTAFRSETKRQIIVDDYRNNLRNLLAMRSKIAKTRYNAPKENELVK